MVAALMPSRRKIWSKVCLTVVVPAPEEPVPEPEEIPPAEATEGYEDSADLYAGAVVAPEEDASPPEKKRARVVRNLRDRRQALQQRLEIEPGAAGEDRNQTIRLAGLKRVRGIIDITPDRIALPGRNMAVEQMRCARGLLPLGPRGQRVQPRIDLHGISIDDRAAKPGCHFQCQCRLAARRRPGYQDRSRFRVYAGCLIHARSNNRKRSADASICNSQCRDSRRSLRRHGST